MQGWFSQPDPFNWDLDKYSLAHAGACFDNGTPSFLPMWPRRRDCLGCCRRRRRHARAQPGAVAQLIALADAKGYRLRSPRESERGGSVMVELPAHIDALALEARLATEGVLADTRGQVLRLRVLTQAAVIDELDRLLPASAAP